MFGTISLETVVINPHLKMSPFKKKIAKKWRDSRGRQWDCEEMNILISKLCNFSAAGKTEPGSTYKRVPKDLFQLLKKTFCGLLSITGVDHFLLSRFRFRHDLWMSKEIFLIIFLFPQLYLENGKTTKNKTFVSLFMCCQSHNRIIFDIYYETTKLKDEEMCP